MTETAIAAIPYPTGICEEPFTLDGVVFTPNDWHSMERATRDGAYIGEVLRDARDDKHGRGVIVSWFARKFDARGELIDWKPMRSAAEARAFIVSKIR